MLRNKNSSASSAAHGISDRYTSVMLELHAPICIPSYSEALKEQVEAKTGQRQDPAQSLNGLISLSTSAT